MDVSKMRATDYLGKTVHCSCGRDHTVEIGTVEISSGALGKVAGILRKDGFRRPFIIADRNTHQAAGEKLLSLLTEEQIAFSSYVLDDSHLVPDEYAMGRLIMNYDPDCDLIIGVGGGTINDSCRFISHRLGIPFYIVATAPSMDGYASTGAPLVRNNFKANYECGMPKAIIADLEVISKAPQRMIAAGFGDMIGKYTCLADWKLSALINDEYYCDMAAAIVRQSLGKIVAAKDGIATGEHGSIAELMDGLVLSGIAMSYVGSSRPASGSEHRLSHFWEIRQLLAGKKALLHGTKVGIATVIMLKLYERLSEEGLDAAFLSTRTMPSLEDWEREIKGAYLDAAPEVFALEERVQKNSAQGWEKRMKVIAQRWPEIQEILTSVPSAREAAELISSVGGSVQPSEVEIDDELVHLAVLYAKEVRPPYTILQLLWDLGLLEDYAAKAI